jgi:RNA polymerase primary sigma factor
MLPGPFPRLPRHEGSPASEPSPLAIYYQQINTTPLLDAAEEKELAYRVLDGDSEARDHLARANLRLVVNIARYFIGKGMDLADLIAEGNLGLLRAIESFDPSMNTRFSTYASYWIRQSIKRGLLNTGKTIRLPAYTNDLLNKWRRATSQLREELGRPPTQEEVARQLQLSPKKFKIVKKALRIHAPLSESTAEQDKGSAVDRLADANTPSPEAELLRTDELHQVLTLLEQMDERPRTVLRLRFGLDGTAPKTLHEIGILLGLTRERVRQIEHEALAGLRDLLGSE